jgi:hypothetical protein
MMKGSDGLTMSSEEEEREGGWNIEGEGGW